jgi:hypothetical protein
VKKARFRKARVEFVVRGHHAVGAGGGNTDAAGERVEIALQEPLYKYLPFAQFCVGFSLGFWSSPL